MPEGLALEFSGVTKRFGTITAVSDFSARVESGLVTGFLGPNGAGKTTTLRILLGLVGATAGTATIAGQPYAKLERPLQTVGAVLEASSFHPGRTAANHLAVYADAAGIPRSRVDEVLGLVGLGDSAGRKVGGFSLGMRQRLGLAYALLGDPGILVLDEPANGLDPEGIKWMRGFLRQLAREGRTVLTSSHLLAEVQQTVDSLLVISQGRLVFQGGLDQLTDPSEYATIVDSPDRAALSAALRDGDVSFEVLRSGLTVRGVEPVEVGRIAASAGVALSSLQRRGPALEEVFLELVNGTRVHSSAAGTSGAAGAAAAEPAVAVANVGEPAAEAEPAGGPAAAAGAAVVAGAVMADSADDARNTAGESAAAEPDAAAESDAYAPDAAADPDAAEADIDTPDGTAPGAAVGSAAFAVAGTGVIDIIPAEDTPTDDESIEAGQPEADVAGGEMPTEQGETHAAGHVAGVFAVDAEGVAVEGDAVAEGEEIAADASDAEPSASDRPWEDYVKTESDLEADAFFASFDAARAEEAERVRAAEAASAAAAAADAGAEPPREGEPETEPASETASEWHAEPEVESESARDAQPEAVTHSESSSAWDAERDAPTESDARVEQDSEPDPVAEAEASPEPEAERDPEPEAERDPEPEPERDSEPEPERDSEPEPEPEPEAEPEPQPEAEASDDEASDDEASDDEASGDDTSEFGSLSDLSPDWVEQEHDRRGNGGGEQR